VVSSAAAPRPASGKAIATRTGADQVAIPTTYAGSEMTDILGETQGGEKTTRRDPSIRPETVIYDVDLTLTLPLGLTVTSALNAYRPCDGGALRPRPQPGDRAHGAGLPPRIRDALPRLAQDPQDRDARAEALYAAWCGSTALAYVSMALHHKLAHTLGGSFGTPARRNPRDPPAPHHRLQRRRGPRPSRPHRPGFGGGSAGGGLWDFAKGHGRAARLQRPGAVARPTSTAPPRSPCEPLRQSRVPSGRDDIRNLLQAAWEGRRPGLTQDNKGRTAHDHHQTHASQDRLGRGAFARDRRARSTRHRAGGQDPARLVSPQTGPSPASRNPTPSTSRPSSPPRRARTSRSSSRTASPTRTAPPRSRRSSSSTTRST
jgi:maleylacetate reductase